MGSLVIKAISKKGEDRLAKTAYASLKDAPFKPLLGGEETTIGAICSEKKVILCVNVATK
eukprot:CAMPEP_0170479898 /NCGR_PEP_ID=MMETSP0208-20121228/949_1 /TAXON_ID=197538 /ORGANISM="Strombidium inclinatum, Strain S3" /LENGTH=59 /DNA_ID=CAMNT_0010752359 /DNA_START=11 /DNA_END=190 /DNA_ORIENTATION=-